MKIREDGFIGLASIFRGEIQLCGTFRETKTIYFARGPSLLHAMKETLRDMLHARAVHVVMRFIIRNRRQGKIIKAELKI
jgi:hypothetical protein